MHAMRTILAAAGFAAALALTPITASALDVQRVVSDQGIEAWLVEDDRVPVIAMNVSFRGGMGLDPEDKAGLANMTASLLDQGAGERDSTAVQSALNDQAIRMSFQATRDSMDASVKTLVDHQDLAFELLSDALVAPRFDDEAVERQRASIMGSIRRDLSSPGWWAARTFNDVSFAGHPYQQPGSGTLETVEAIAAEDLADFAAGRFALDNLTVSVAGNIDADTLAEALDRIFGSLPEASGPYELDMIDMQAQGETFVVERSGPQTVLMMGMPGIARDDPEWHAAQVLNHVLGGGGFGSRLMEEVRERRGLTYGISSGLSALDYTNQVMIRASTSNDRAGEALEVVRQVLADVAENGITEEELIDAQTYLTGSFPLRLTSTDGIASVLMSMQLDGLGMDYVDRRSDLLNAVTLDDVRAVARRVIRPETLTVVAVGRPDGIEPTRVIEDAEDQPS